MKEDTNEPVDAAEMRRQVEARLDDYKTNNHISFTQQDAQRLVHELQVHQIELELQNQELQKSRAQLEAWLEQYTDLYDFAPVGYFTLNSNGDILQVNLTGAHLLNVDRSQLLNRRFGLFVSFESRSVFSEFLEHAFRNSGRESCELLMSTETGESFNVRLDAMVSTNAAECRIALIDITEQKQIEAARLFLLQCGWSNSSGDFFQLLAWYLSDTLGMDYVCIDRLLEDQLTARTVAVYYDGVYEDNLDYTLKETPCGQVLGKTVCSFQEGVRDLFPQDTALQKMNAEGYVGTTLWSSQGQPIGLIAMISRKPICNLKRAESLLQLVSIRAAGELERKLAEEALARSNEQVTQILESISDAFFTLDKEWRFTYVNREAQNILKASREQLLGQFIYEAFPGTIGTIFHTECERAMQEVSSVQFESYYAPFDAWFEVRAYPYQEGLSVYFRDCSERRMAQETQLQASKRNAHIVDMLQQIILPPRIPMQTPGYKMATKYQPALLEAEVCGDFYDVFEVGEGKIGIVIGDVIGKGLLAAARVAAVRHTIRSYAFFGNQPSEIMRLVNNALVRETVTESDMFTAFFAILDTCNNSISYTNAGHEPPVFRHTDGSIESLTEGGPMFLGIGDQNYSDGILEFDDGDVLVMVTDGITEARTANNSDQFGANGIVACLLENAGASTEQIASKLVEDATTFAGGTLRDDIAVIVIKKI